MFVTFAGFANLINVNESHHRKRNGKKDTPENHFDFHFHVMKCEKNRTLLAHAADFALFIFGIKRTKTIFNKNPLNSIQIMS